MSGAVTARTTYDTTDVGIAITISATVTIAAADPTREQVADAVTDLTDALRRQVMNARINSEARSQSHEERSA